MAQRRLYACGELSGAGKFVCVFTFDQDDEDLNSFRSENDLNATDMALLCIQTQWFSRPGHIYNAQWISYKSHNLDVMPTYQVDLDALKLEDEE